MTTEISENDLLNTTETEKLNDATHPLQALQQTIAAMPVIDIERVENAMQKIRDNKLAIFGTDEERMACAERIAKQLIDETNPKD